MYRTFSKQMNQLRRFSTVKQVKSAEFFISPLTLLNQQKDPTFYNNHKLVDVRTHDVYDAQHIKNAVNIHEFFTYLQETSCSEGMKKMENFFIDILSKNGITGNDDENVIVYEQGLSKLFGASCRSFFILKFLGHPNVSVLQGGLDNYIFVAQANDVDLSNLLTSEETIINKTEYSRKADMEWMCDSTEILNDINDDNVCILDVRDKDEWIGASSSPYGVDFCPRKGRIPNSKWIEWYDFMEENMDNPNGVKKHKSNDDIEQMMNDIGVKDKNQKILVYCFKGSRASNTLMALKAAGYNNVKNYFASWNEWSRDSKLPVDDQVLSLS